MATDVSGTIHIIAEVMGDANSPVTGTGSRTSAKEKRDRKATTIGVLGMEIELKTIIKYLAIGGIIANSKIIGTSVSFIFRMIGVISDLMFGPLVRIMLPALKDLFQVFTVMSQLLDGETTWSDVWQGLKVQWALEWSKGGVSGLIKKAFADLVPMLFLGTFFASWVLGPGAGVFIFKHIFALTGAQFAVNYLGYALGLKKVKLSSVRKGNKAARAGRWLRQGFLNAGRMVLSFLPRTAIMSKLFHYLAAIGGIVILDALDFIKELSNGGWKQIVFEGLNLVSFGTWQQMSDALGLDMMKPDNPVEIILSLLILTSPIGALILGDMILGHIIGKRPSEIWATFIDGMVRKVLDAIQDARDSLFMSLKDGYELAESVFDPRSYIAGNPLSNWFRDLKNSFTRDSTWPN